MRPRVLVVRGHQGGPWELGAWERLTDRFDVHLLVTGSGMFDTAGVRLPVRRAAAVRDVLPPGRLGDALVRLPGDRYLRPAGALAGFDVVHAQETGTWYSDQAARLAPRLGHRLVLTVWETLPLADAYRNVRTRPFRRRTLAAADLLLPTTERAAAALLLEGADPGRVVVCPPGVDLARYAAAATAAPAEHVVLSVGRLVWEKGHQDAVRAVAALRSGLVPSPVRDVRLLVVGQGPERDLLLRYAAELGVGDLVEVRPFVPHDRMPAVYAQASCLVLASLPVRHWEEQFGMVLVEAMAAGLPVLATASGAVAEVVGASAARLVPGDWLGLARELAAGPLTRPPGERVAHDGLERYSQVAAAERWAAAYDRVLA